jgi:hypothetical protein
MKPSLCVAAAFLGLVGFLLPACQTAEPGAKSLLGTYSTVVQGSPDEVTGAARSAAEDLGLIGITSTNSDWDGHVTARTAQNEHVTIDITRTGSSISRVEVRVGEAGNEWLSNELLDQIKRRR